MQFYQHSCQFRSPLPKHEVVRTVTLEEDQAKCVEEKKSTRELLELQNRVQDLERALLGHHPGAYNLKELLMRKVNL